MARAVGRRTAATLALLLLAAACGGQRPPAADDRAGETVQRLGAVAPVQPAGTESAGEVCAPSAVEAAHTVALPPPPDPEFEAAFIASPPELPARRLLGMSRGEVAVLLGRPSLRREEPSSEVWQYAAGPCVLHVFLYAESAQTGLHVSHYEIRHGEAKARAASDCFEAVLHRDESAAP